MTNGSKNLSGTIRFNALMRGLLHVSKDELDAEIAKEQKAKDAEKAAKVKASKRKPKK